MKKWTRSNIVLELESVGCTHTTLSSINDEEYAKQRDIYGMAMRLGYDCPMGHRMYKSLGTTLSFLRTKMYSKICGKCSLTLVYDECSKMFSYMYESRLDELSAVTDISDFTSTYSNCTYISQRAFEFVKKGCSGELVVVNNDLPVLSAIDGGVDTFIIGMSTMCLGIQGILSYIQRCVGTAKCVILLFSGQYTDGVIRIRGGEYDEDNVYPNLDTWCIRSGDLDSEYETYEMWSTIVSRNLLGDIVSELKKGFEKYHSNEI